MQQSDSIKHIMEALGKFQEACLKIRKDAKNPFFKSKYASLSNILDEIQPTLTSCKLSYTQPPQGSDKLITTLCHWESGEWIRSEYDLNCVESLAPDYFKLLKDYVIDKQLPLSVIPAELSVPVITPQSLGSGITYARRYALTAILGLNIDDDDDGNAASGNKVPQQPQPQPQPQQPQSVAIQPATPLTAFNKKYTDINVLTPVIATAKAVIELNTLYAYNKELLDKNQAIIKDLANKKLSIENGGKLIITDLQFEQVCARINKGDTTTLQSALNAYILNPQQVEKLNHLHKQIVLFDEALKLKYDKPEDILTLIEKCPSTAHVMRLHQNNALIIDRNPELTTRINARIKELKVA